MEAVLTEELDEEEQLVRRHRKEKKELQAKIQSMKNAVPRNDKKRRKQLTEDVAKLEAEMEQKQREELDQLKLTSKESKIDSVAVNISNLVLENQPLRISKAQKRRDKKLVYKMLLLCQCADLSINTKYWIILSVSEKTQLP
uniref:OTU deubiquitinase 6B n=1 Tax=Bos mutus grunniens TaxID=30521 RepID=A0A8B9WS41_BOSMU